MPRELIICKNCGDAEFSDYIDTPEDCNRCGSPRKIETVYTEEEHNQELHELNEVIIQNEEYISGYKKGKEVGNEELQEAISRTKKECALICNKITETYFMTSGTKSETARECAEAIRRME